MNLLRTRNYSNCVIPTDISIWLHQMVKGYQDAKGAPLPNAHLMGLFQRLCKLLYFRIKPVFVFDGGFPDLKRETIVSANCGVNFGTFGTFSKFV